MAAVNRVPILAALRMFYNQELKARMDKKKVKWMDAWSLYAFDRRFRAVPFGHLTHCGMDVLQFVPRNATGATTASPNCQPQHIRLLISYETLGEEGAVRLYVLRGLDAPVDAAVRVATAPLQRVTLHGQGLRNPKVFNVLPLVRWMLHLATE
jgi:hypothetical protein